MKAKIVVVILLLIYQDNLVGQEVLNAIEQRIMAAYGQSVASQTDEFIPIIAQLESAYQENPNADVHYWLAFAEYRAAILHMNGNDEKHALELLNRGMKRLEKLENPDSEDLALLGSMLSLSINFQPDLAAILSAKANNFYEKAIQLSDQNLRAFLGVGRSDFYKPKEYGGGLKVESYLKQALMKPDQNSNSPHKPTWGKDDAFYYLASFYKREGRLDEAKLYCNKGLRAYPDHYLLQTLKTKL